MQVFLNDRFVDIGEARVPALDAGFLVGHGAFETMRAYRGRVFRLAQHLNRLDRTCAAIGVPFQSVMERWEQTIAALLARNRLSDARVRLTVTAGPQETAQSAPTVLLAAFPLPDDRPATSGWRACLYRGVVSSRDPLRLHKTTSYIEKVLARQEARNGGFDEALFVNEKGNVTEGSTTNVFCVREGNLVTPPLAEGLLPGITREVVAELVARAGIPFTEQPLSVADLVRSDEAFLTNSIIEIVPLVAVGETSVGDGRPGLLTTRLQAAYRELVSQELSNGK